MKKQYKNLADWKKYWLQSTDLNALRKSLNHIDRVYEEVRNSIGRVLMSMEMIEIQEVLENRIEELTVQQKSTKVAA
jgi:chaperonin cofactor prefoldin